MPKPAKTTPPTAPTRSHGCGGLTTAEVAVAVELCGWVDSRRDHGGVIFIDLRDRTGHVQIVADPAEPQPFAVADGCRNEYVIAVRGLVRTRPAGTENAAMKTGQIEVVASEILVLNAAVPLPFQLDDTEIGEATRLKYRYLDLRRPAMQQTLRTRHQIISTLRDFLHQHEFVEIETPILTRSTPEGARDYLVPSRTQPGAFFALPQSPQLFKQLLMVAGFERYYQVARCFRDEDLRADRQPEFTQLDIETAFMNETEIMQLMETMVRTCFEQVLAVTLPPLPVLTYAEAISRYGTDHPDLRIAMQLCELTDLMRTVEFKVFNQPANAPQGRVAVLCVPGGGQLTRAQIDAYTEYVAQFGAKGLAYIKVKTIAAGRAGLQSPILKFLPDEVLTEILTRSAAKDGDLLFFGADRARIVNEALGALRVKVAEDLGLVTAGWQPLWVVDFPLLAKDDATAQWQSLHHPFTAPKPEHIDWLDSQPERVLSRAYDLVMNGSELGGGSIRIHQAELQRQVFATLGITAAEAAEKFGFLLDGLTCGAPPHGGIAFGIDRLVAMMCGVASIREVIAFPKTQKASCPLTDAPNAVDALQLRALGLRAHAPPRGETSQ